MPARRRGGTARKGGTPCRNCWKNWRRSGSTFDIPGKTRRLNELDRELSDPDLWSNAARARQVTQEAGTIRRIVDGYSTLQSDATGLEEMLAMASAEEQELLAEEQEGIQKRVDDLYRETLFTMKHADTAAIVRVKSGAGGTESQDWAGMLSRMFMRWAERHGFKAELLDQQDGEQAGVISSEFIIRGEKAFGMMAPEHGVHRLVRVSPFDSNNRRHTSFASVDVVPEVPEEQIDIHIPDSDLRRDVFRSQGAGGQGVNTTDSAVRLTHLPTGIAVASQVTRSQIKNHEIALQILKQRLYDIEMKKREAEEAKARGEQKKIEWGSQIRSYVLDKQYVKDHRTGVMKHNPDDVLDGDLDELMWAGLEWMAGKRVSEEAGDDE
ncbi:peptide chain release factor 2 [Deinococcus metalli]|uniref:Peptide chain release factor 2 n=1 Tax=Deinococcus metalli TaxID=1141878 RepID=A0A7W8NR14_9DEIO|nr:peptide chain release factor 2 [Deinococcus metalli]GHF58964.1 peptide chain release factor 2 [Deinococcus metalli]